MAFVFSDYYNWLDENLENLDIFSTDENIHCWIFERKNDWKKFNNKNAIDDFLLQKINRIRKCNDISEDIYPNGIYVVLDYKQNWIMFVYPVEKFNTLFADHYSIPYNAKAKKQVQFHATQYVPSNIDKSYGMVVHKPCHFKDKDTIEDIRFDKIFPKIEEDAIKQLLSLSDRKEGGTKRKLPQKTVLKKPRHSTNDNDLHNCWQNNKMSHIVVVCFKVEDKYCFTCSIYDSIKRNKNVAHTGFAFTMNRLDTSQAKKKIVKILLERYL